MRTIAALLLPLLLGCSREEPSSSSTSSSSSSSSARTTWPIRASQGGVAGDDAGAQVTLPPDAVKDDVDVAITSSDADDADAAGRTWTLKVDGRDRFTFEKPVRLSVPIDRSRAPADSEVALCVQQDGDWQPVPGSRVEGDRAVADVGHFSTYAPRKMSNDERKRWLNREYWHGTVHISIYGSGRRGSDGDETSFNIGRDVQMTFRIPQQPGEAAGALALERLRKSGMKLPKDAEKGMLELLTVRHWTTPYQPKDEDRTELRFTIDDRYDSSGEEDGEGGRTGERYESHGRLKGEQNEKVAATHRLKIDTAKGTYTFSGQHDLTTKLKLTEWATGTPEKTLELPARYRYEFKDRPLPTKGNVIKGRLKIPRKEADKYIGQIPSGWSFDFGSLRGSISWTLSPGPPLVARIRPPYAYKRGDLVTLDGSGSLGDIQEYRWRVKVEESLADAPAWPREYTGPKVTFRALWDFTAELEVTSRTGGIDGTDQLIEIRPREGWRTTWTTPTQGDLTAAPMIATEKRIGLNECAKHPEDKGGHRIHKTTASGKTWSDVYEIGSVEEDGGPFAGMHYIVKQSLDVDRIERVNRRLKPGGDVYNLNKDKGTLAAVEALLAQVKAHEAAHSSLMKKELDRLVQAGQDPAEQIEMVVALTSASAQERADDKIRAAETALVNASSEKNVKAILRRNRDFLKHVAVWLPAAPGAPDNREPTPLGQLSEIGDE